MVEKNPYYHQHYTHVKDEKEADAVAWVFLNQDEFVKFPFKFEELGEDEIRANVIYTSLCQSDAHTGRGKWGKANWPLATGHEIVAIVSKVGKNVKKFKVGDRIAYSPCRDSCDECRECCMSMDNLCQGLPFQRVFTYGEYWGGYSTAIQQPAKWAFKVPENLPSDRAPPLLCAGVTVFAPLAKYARAGDRVAVIGIGGLGHLAVMYANKFGCRVTAMSGSPNKKELIKELGAHDIVNSRDVEELAKHASKFDVVINTVSSVDDKLYSAYLDLVAACGTFVQVGAPPNDQLFKFCSWQLIAKNARLAGSFVGSRREIKAMLEFSSQHNVLPICEFFGFDDFPKALDKLEKGKAVFRCVVNVQEWSKKNGLYKEY